MKAIIFKNSNGELRAEESVTHVQYEIAQGYLKLKEGQVVSGKIVEHSNQDRIHQMYFEIYETPELPLNTGEQRLKLEQFLDKGHPYISKEDCIAAMIRYANQEIQASQSSVSKEEGWTEERVLELIVAASNTYPCDLNGAKEFLTEYKSKNQLK